MRWQTGRWWLEKSLDWWAVSDDTILQTHNTAPHFIKSETNNTFQPDEGSSSISKTSLPISLLTASCLLSRNKEERFDIIKEKEIHLSFASYERGWSGESWSPWSQLSER